MDKLQKHSNCKNSFIAVDDNLISYAERRAKEILGEDMAYSPKVEVSMHKGQKENSESDAEECPSKKR